MIPFEQHTSQHAGDRAPSGRDGRQDRTSTISSAELLAHGKLIHIQHRGELYSLRETRLGKLILTK